MPTSTALPDAILIAGPTASGKSDLAIELAERYGGVIVNADSMQVYDELRVLTARPSVQDEARVPHQLYGHVDPGHAYSAGQYAIDAAITLKSICATNKLPIIVGGTGLYFKVLLEGLSPVPQISTETRSYWRDASGVRSVSDLHAELARRDPVMAQRLVPTDRQRIVRALEVIEDTGVSLAEWQTKPGTPILSADRAFKILVMPPRDVLHDRANRRFKAMVAAGAVDEVEHLLSRNLDPGLPAMRALGVRAIADWIGGRIDKDEAVGRGQSETRQYIKRQSTWLNRNMITWSNIFAQETKSQLGQILTFIDF